MTPRTLPSQPCAPAATPKGYLPAPLLLSACCGNSCGRTHRSRNITTAGTVRRRGRSITFATASSSERTAAIAAARNVPHPEQEVPPRPRPAPHACACAYQDTLDPSSTTHARTQRPTPRHRRGNATGENRNARRENASQLSRLPLSNGSCLRERRALPTQKAKHRPHHPHLRPRPFLEVTIAREMS